MPSLNASPVRSGESCSTTSSSSVRITSGASSPSTSAFTTKRVRTKPSVTSSRFHDLSRQRVGSTQSPYSVASITTTGVSLDEILRQMLLVRTGFVASTGEPWHRGQVREITYIGLAMATSGLTRRSDVSNLSRLVVVLEAPHGSEARRYACSSRGQDGTIVE